VRLVFPHPGVPVMAIRHAFNPLIVWGFVVLVIKVVALLQNIDVNSLYEETSLQ
jgi:hypothetical protein